MLDKITRETEERGARQNSLTDLAGTTQATAGLGLGNIAPSTIHACMWPVVHVQRRGICAAASCMLTHYCSLGRGKTSLIKSVELTHTYTHTPCIEAVRHMQSGYVTYI